jgi:hypothetical protein
MDKSTDRLQAFPTGKLVLQLQLQRLFRSRSQSPTNRQPARQAAQHHWHSKPSSGPRVPPRSCPKSAAPPLVLPLGISIPAPPPHSHRESVCSTSTSSARTRAATRNWCGSPFASASPRSILSTRSSTSTRHGEPVRACCPNPSQSLQIPDRSVTPGTLAAAGQFELDKIRQELNATSKKIGKLKAVIFFSSRVAMGPRGSVL